MRISLSMILMLPIIAITGCASVTRGVNEDVVIIYEPADAAISTSLNHTCSSSPCTIQVARKKAFQVTGSKTGYHSQTVQVNTKVSGGGAAGFAGNVIVGGVIGMGVDAATGATLNHTPNPVVIKLVPEDANADTGPVNPPKKQGASPTAPVS